MLEIISPTSYRVEREYIISLLFDEFWRIHYHLSWSEIVKDKIVFQKAERALVLHDGLFRLPERVWLKEESIPRKPLQKWDVSQDFPELETMSPCPIIYRADVLQAPVQIKENSIEFDLDILGSCFFMLTRYEEMASKNYDAYGRFSAKTSLAYRAGFLERPIVNEYMEILWIAMHRLFPALERKRRTFRLIPTHDLDHPFGMMYESSLQILRHFAGDLLYRKSFTAIGERMRELWEFYFHKKTYIQKKKETYTFLYKVSQKHNLKDIFFLMDSMRSPLDGNYTLGALEVIELFREIHAKGHALGLHPSYESYLDKAVILRETEHANRVLADYGLPSLAGARQHYLRWRNPDTWQNYEAAGIPLDSSVGFADWVGFRCGICYEYPVFDLRARRQLRLRELPLIVMDGTLKDYMRLLDADAMEKVLALAKECMRYRGDFVVLWHNTTLDDEANRAFYKEMIERIQDEYDRRAAIE